MTQSRARGPLSLWLDGQPLPSQILPLQPVSDYGHYTVMQVRGGRARGLGLHLQRLQSAHRELFGSHLPRGLILDHLVTATRDRLDSEVRATYFEDSSGIHDLVAVGPPVDPPSAAVSLLPYRYTRPFAHLKHVGTFAQRAVARIAQHRGCDDALLVTERDEIAETTRANIGFVSGPTLTWPGAPSLLGTGEQLVTSAWRDVGGVVVRSDVGTSEVGRFEGAFLVSSTGISPVRSLGKQEYSDADELARRVRAVHASVAFDLLTDL